MLDTQKSFSALSEEFVECLLRDHPVWATDAGIHDYDAKLPRDTPEGFRERAAWLRDLEQRLVAGVPWKELPVESRVEYGLLRARISGMRADLEEIKTQTRDAARFPETALLAVHLLLSRSFAALDERKEAILARMMAVPEYLEGAQANLVPAPLEAIEHAAQMSGSGITFMEEVTHQLIRHFPAEAERIEHAGSLARRGFAQYQEFLRAELAPRAVDAAGIGERWMNYKLEREHLLGMDAAALESFARDQIARTRVRLEEEARRIDATRTWPEQLEEAKRHHPEPLAILDAYAAEARRAEEFLIQKRLVPQVEGRLEITDTPEFLRATLPPVSYRAPAPFDADPVGCLQVTPIELGLDPALQQERLAEHHHAVITLRVAGELRPGRHLQSGHAMRAPSRLRRIAASPLFADGWALYATDLMWQEGFFTDPAARLDHLRLQLEAACRAVVDVSLHSGRATLDQCATLLTDEAALGPAAARRTALTIALHPGRGMSGLIGRELLLALREEARRRLGAKFNLYDFHEALLAGGALPPALVREELWSRLGV